MEVDAKSHTCPICGYEFPTRSTTLKWVAIVLVLLLLLLWVF
jgi:RNA polymerase subunit RPABC4/transcription elongation factor Spt4